VLKQVLGVYDQAVADGEEDSIDTCTLMRQYGHEISRVEGPRTNIKITTASDYYICRTFFTLNEDKAAFGGE
jgi:2-C-methyl-D-erythritol 4-phosphate cytidylyltransferase